MGGPVPAAPFELGKKGTNSITENVQRGLKKTREGMSPLQDRITQEESDVKSPRALLKMVGGTVVAGGPIGPYVAFKGKNTAKDTGQEFKNVTGIQDKENQAERNQQALFSLLNTRSDTETAAPPLNTVTGQTETMSAANSETQRRRLIARLRAGFASTLRTGSGLLAGNVSAPQAGSKTLLGE